MIPGERPQAALAIHIPKTPDPAVTKTWADLFGAARTEIWLSAAQLDAEIVLQALRAAAARQVNVYVILSPGHNSKPDAGARAWFRQRTVIRNVRIARHRFDGTACVVDGAYVVVTAQAIVPAAANALDGGIFLYSANAEMAAVLRSRLASQYADSSPDIPSR
jgi:phosphatidylserine/phosphatidylglycerophosphate/cardiolipin synthase-like enzyme